MRFALRLDSPASTPLPLAAAANAAFLAQRADHGDDDFSAVFEGQKTSNHGDCRFARFGAIASSLASARVVVGDSTPPVRHRRDSRYTHRRAAETATEDRKGRL